VPRSLLCIYAALRNGDHCKSRADVNEPAKPDEFGRRDRPGRTEHAEHATQRTLTPQLALYGTFVSSTHHRASFAVPERGHASALTRTDATSAVHYLQLPVSASRVEYGCTLDIDHPTFRVDVALTHRLVDELNSEL
jgi:hypothetical protein